MSGIDMLRNEEFLDYAYNQNAILHDNLRKQYRYLGSGTFISTYYDSKTNMVIKAFRLDVMNDSHHSQTIAEDAPELFCELLQDIQDQPKKVTQVLKDYIFKTNLDWARYCKKNHKRNTHLPKVYDIKILPEYFAYIIYGERLYPTAALGMRASYKFGNCLCTAMTECLTSQSKLSIYLYPEYFGLRKDNYLKNMEYIEVEELNKLLNKLSKKFNNYTPDLHIRNLMFRIEENQKRLILNDPFY